jgi:hypothetical protein
MTDDIKELVGVLMRLLAGEEIATGEVLNVRYDVGSDDAASSVNAAYVGVMEFIDQRDRRTREPDYDRAMRARLQHHLDEIVRQFSGPGNETSQEQ